MVTFKKQENSTLKLLIMGIEKEIFIQIGSINSEMLLDAILKAQEALSKNNSQPPLLPKIPSRNK